ncbi:MAG: permease [Candidatus Omnitrophica bacterium]|nr:permease [Candidatus Omnitrophota bacterium]MCM8802612.1 permease [Candidatus Omnitrophota bacterium]
MVFQFIYNFKDYLLEILPALAIGFFLSGLIHEFVPTNWVEKELGKKSIKPILYATTVGTIVPVCCWGSLPLAITFYMKGASLGPVLAILVATPATSINALIVAGKFFGIKFAIYIFFSVILMGLIIGLIGNLFKFKVNIKTCLHCDKEEKNNQTYKTKTFIGKMKSVFRYAYIELPKEIGLETLLGLVLAALISTLPFAGKWIKNYLYGTKGYLFAITFGLAMYMCATMSVPLVYALVEQGLNIGAGLTLLLVGPITSYGTILVIRKEFGIKVLLVYLVFICLSSLVLGHLYSIILK